jgi:hypothetical protein
MSAFANTTSFFVFGTFLKFTILWYNVSMKQEFSNSISGTFFSKIPSFLYKLSPECHQYTLTQY